MSSLRSEKFVVGVMLSVQRALLGEIIPPIVAVSVEISDLRIRIWVYHDGGMTLDEQEDFDRTVVSQVIGDFEDIVNDGPNTDVSFVKCDPNIPIQSHGILAFARSGTKWHCQNIG